MTLLVVLLILLTSTVSSFIVRQSVQHDAFERQRLVEGRRFRSELSATSTTSSDDQNNNNRRWLDQGLLLSSFTDGLKNNEQTQDWMLNAVVNALWMEEQVITQQQLRSSVVVSPCNGPDPNLLTQLENVDNAVSGRDDSSSSSSSWKSSWKMLCEIKQNRILSTLSTDESPPEVEIRVVFIPTASYALRSDSTATPGKQRQRARADGKKRRNEMVQLLQQGFENADNNLDSNQRPNISVRAVTLDLDDGSIKQPEASSSSSSAPGSPVPSFPSSGEEAIGSWAPHLIYVQGGNTFWLYHCMEKGDWKNKIIDACSTTETEQINRNDETTNADESSNSERFSAVYCGVSAGAIVVGQSMQTACWKEWDDPSVVPGRETYNDWRDIRGLDLVGDTSFFPHMDDRWKSLVEKRRKELPFNLRDDDDDDQSICESNADFDVCCLTDFDVCTVNGKERSMNVVSNILSLL
mmetsp:Transcript_19682/g.47533  ORF Transcript_19682/g.47533 Transcript_19682/m.47533 type:complete len:466 (+) Transcript_19682:101-1498(+)